MRVVLVGFFAADYLISLANALAKSVALTLITSNETLGRYLPSYLDQKAGFGNIEILSPSITLRTINYPKGHYLQKFSIPRDLMRMISTIQPDVVHIQSAGEPWLPLALPVLHKFTLVTTIHDASRHLGDGQPFLAMELAYSFLVGFSQQVIVHGQQQAGILARKMYSSSEKIKVVPLGPYAMYKTLAEGQVSSEPHTILFFGRLRAYKGIEVLLRAAPLIAAQIPDVRIVIAGSGDYPVVQDAANENPDWFEVHNRFISSEEVAQFFQRSSVVVLPYLEASQSGVVPVAYQFGKPVVATNVGSIPEVVDDGKTGLLVEPGNEYALADAVIRLLKDAPFRAALGEAAKAKSEQDLSWDSIASRTLDVYEIAKFKKLKAPSSEKRANT